MRPQPRRCSWVLLVDGFHLAPAAWARSRPGGRAGRGRPGRRGDRSTAGGDEARGRHRRLTMTARRVTVSAKEHTSQSRPTCPSPGTAWPPLDPCQRVGRRSRCRLTRPAVAPPLPRRSGTSAGPGPRAPAGRRSRQTASARRRPGQVATQQDADRPDRRAGQRPAVVVALAGHPDQRLPNRSSFSPSSAIHS